VNWWLSVQTFYPTTLWKETLGHTLKVQRDLKREKKKAERGHSRDMSWALKTQHKRDIQRGMNQTTGTYRQKQEKNRELVPNSPVL